MSSAPSNPSDPIFRIEALRAGAGQCLLVHLGTVGEPRLVIIDGGPPETWERELKPRLEQIRRERGMATLDIDAVILTAWGEEFSGGILRMISKESYFFSESRLNIIEITNPFVSWSDSKETHYVQQYLLDAQTYAGYKLSHNSFSKEYHVEIGEADIRFTRSIDVDRKSKMGRVLNLHINIAYRGAYLFIFPKYLPSALFCDTLSIELRKDKNSLFVFSDYFMLQHLVENYLISNAILSCSVTKELVEKGVTGDDADYYENMTINALRLKEMHIGFSSAPEIEIIKKSASTHTYWPGSTDNLIYDLIDRKFLTVRTGKNAALATADKQPNENIPSRHYIHIDVLELIFLLTLSGYMTPNFLMHPTASGLNRALARANLSISRPEHLTLLVHQLRSYYPRAQPNPVWLAWMRETQADTITQLNKMLESILLDQNSL